MLIFVTGSNGFVGSRLMWELEKLGHQVYGIDCSTHCKIKTHPKTTIGDIRVKEDLHKFDHIHFDLIIHCAASKHDFGISDEEYYSNNEFGTQVLMDYAREQNIKRILYYSTVSAYGHYPMQVDETAEFRPNTVYGASKLAGEFVIDTWLAEDSEREAIYLRPTIIYGPHNYANMYNLIDVMHRKPWLTIGNGNHVKSIVSLSNLIDMTLFAMEHFKPGKECFNCTDQPYITLHQLMEIIAKDKRFKMPSIVIPLKVAVFIGMIFDVLAMILKRDIPINSDRMRKFATATDYSSQKIRDWGYVQHYTIEGEIKKTTDWYLETYKNGRIE